MSEFEITGGFWLPQNNLVIQGRTIEVHYYNRRPMWRDWFCNAGSGLSNHVVIPTYVIFLFLLWYNRNKELPFMYYSVICQIWGKWGSVWGVEQQKGLSCYYSKAKEYLALSCTVRVFCWHTITLCVNHFSLSLVWIQNCRQETTLQTVSVFFTTYWNI